MSEKITPQAIVDQVENALNSNGMSHGEKQEFFDVLTTALNGLARDHELKPSLQRPVPPFVDLHQQMLSKRARSGGTGLGGDGRSV